MKRLYSRSSDALKNCRGLGTVELVVLVVVLIGLALLFRTQITEIMTGILDNIDTENITIQTRLLTAGIMI
ncbi:Flp1 family type IVb pilin [Acidaminobacter hydrogenoformans]|uniref:Putative Flagellin, Flp1-like, domain n=1 Tax=Acidaminobacter hydrogenoformans DSM 2784 TaxID=1120920 RepID=A0A1G5RUG8_9FIRM|nr:Flp1 family type IVb pilin [Acidaminobacter hydrogenoformans]SCZ77091.1 Putative Flagellin, Flp1-like, domain [Acidaminobacter hydrogenoformans DSM 2784]